MKVSAITFERAIDFLYRRFIPVKFKNRVEMRYWSKRHSIEKGDLSNAHYKPLYTELFQLVDDDYRDKKVLDIGCGPRGSLEWADMAAERVGLDPLADKYGRLGAHRHKMAYVTASSDDIPFPDAHFDFVTCLNALDHVDDFDATVAEIKRVTRPGGLCLITVEIDHPPTATEPLTITADLLRRFEPEFEVLSARNVGVPDDHDLHRAVQTGQPAYESGKPGVRILKMKRRA